jgi:DNA-binding XRE family transcriptional regulator
MTVLEMRAMLARVDARKLRKDAGLRAATVAEALGVDPFAVYAWETGKCEPKCDAGYRWLRVIAGLERHAAVTAEMWRARDEAA